MGWAADECGGLVVRQSGGRAGGIGERLDEEPADRRERLATWSSPAAAGDGCYLGPRAGMGPIIWG